MKKIQTSLSVLILLGFILLISSCVKIETTRFAMIDRTEGSIYFRVNGFNTALFSSEGSFPEWTDDLQVIMKPRMEIPKTGKQTFAFGSDFSARYNAVESATMVIDQDKKEIELKVKYVEAYSWSKAKGHFPITAEK